MSTCAARTLTDQEFDNVESIIHATIEELVVLKRHLENEEGEQALDVLNQCHINTYALTTMIGKEGQ